MRHYCLALALAAASLAFTVSGHAGLRYGEERSSILGRTCVTKEIRNADRDGRAVMRRVRLCR
ncbi:hypothetical protein [Thauera sp. SDU_THAU2]|uniref:hypothetical protein n=1 Tax=Thauera sp. SDU_THAU2 TaxID=3136633 RepID=UPI00311E53D9